MITRPSITFSRKVACGHIYATFAEFDNGTFHKLLLSGDMTKEAPCGSSVLWSFQKVLTFALRRAFKEGGDTLDIGLIKHLQYHQCNRFHVGVDKSCSDAVAKLVQQYLSYVKKRETTETETETKTKETTEKK